MLFRHLHRRRTVVEVAIVRVLVLGKSLHPSCASIPLGSVLSHTVIHLQRALSMVLLLLLHQRSVLALPVLHGPSPLPPRPPDAGRWLWHSFVDAAQPRTAQSVRLCEAQGDVPAPEPTAYLRPWSP